jgi:flagellar hook-associated protein 2
MASSIISAAASAPVFTGQSSFASSLQNSLSRAVQLASLPMKLIQAQVQTLQSQQSSLNNMESTFNTLQNDLQTLNSAQAGSVGASSSSSAVSASASTGAMAGAYSIQVIRVGSGATALSNQGSTLVTDPTTQNIDSSGSFTLSLDGTTTTITPSGTSLQALAQAINDSGAPVQATIVNLGGAAGADYRLALSSSDFSVQNIQLTGAGAGLLGTITGGTTAQYQVNGSSTIDASSNHVTISTGLTANLLQSTSSPAVITVSKSTSGLSSALAGFVSDYNAAVDALNQHTGTSGGALAGSSLLHTLSSVLRSLPQYAGGAGPVNSFADLGLTLNRDNSGHLTLDSSVFNSLKIADVQQFLGGLTSGGFLQTANDALSSVTDSTTGMIHVNFTSLQSHIDLDNAHISADQLRITNLQNSLILQLSAADATIASLESQKNYFLQMFQAQYPASTASGG